MIISEKKLTTTATKDSFDEIYTNYDLSVNEQYSAENGYPFDYPTRWHNDTSMNKRIAIRRLDATPMSHSFTIGITSHIEEPITSDGKHEDYYHKTIKLDITEFDNLVKFMNYLCSEFSYTNNNGVGRLAFTDSNSSNRIHLTFYNTNDENCEFSFTNNTNELLRFLNQEITTEAETYIEYPSKEKIFNEVWNRDRLHFHASFSTSRRKFIGKRGDFYQNLSLLYPPPTNESTFYVRMTSKGIKNILLRYCEIRCSIMIYS